MGWDGCARTAVSGRWQWAGGRPCPWPTIAGRPLPVGNRDSWAGERGVPFGPFRRILGAPRPVMFAPAHRRGCGGISPVGARPGPGTLGSPGPVHVGFWRQGWWRGLWRSLSLPSWDGRWYNRRLSVRERARDRRGVPPGGGPGSGTSSGGCSGAAWAGRRHRVASLLRRTACGGQCARCRGRRRNHRRDRSIRRRRTSRRRGRNVPPRLVWMTSSRSL